MFGYVKALTPELRVKEFELYRSVYCGLCHHIKMRSPFMTFSLSYDFVLPALFSLAFTDVESISFKKKRCLAHPMKKRKVIDGGENMQAVADASILLVYYKLLDDKTDKDEKFGKKISSSLALPFAARARKKVLAAGYREIDSIIKEKKRQRLRVRDYFRRASCRGLLRTCKKRVRPPLYVRAWLPCRPLDIYCRCP